MAPTILVVDDDDDIRTVTQLALERIAGWNVVLAGDGPTAIESARATQPDAILLDMMMPGMDGLTTFDHLRGDSATSHIPVVFFTAKRNAASTTIWGQRDVQGVIAKPFDPLALADELGRALSWSSALTSRAV